MQRSLESHLLAETSDERFNLFRQRSRCSAFLSAPSITHPHAFRAPDTPNFSEPFLASHPPLRRCIFCLPRNPCLSFHTLCRCRLSRTFPDCPVSTLTPPLPLEAVLPCSPVSTELEDRACLPSRRPKLLRPDSTAVCLALAPSPQ